MTQPLISVLIPVYNVAAYVEEAITSILHQTYRNLEIIVVDDASTDNTYELVQELAKQDSRIKLFRNQTNRQIVETLNFAFAQATGTYIARMDGDDVSLPSKIEEQYKFLIRNPGYDLVGTSLVMVDEEGQKIHDEKYISSFEGIVTASKYFSPISHIWLSKREVYDKIGPYRIPTVEDYDFILRAIDSGFKLYNLPDFLYLARQRNGNTATAKGLQQLKSFEYVRKLQKERRAHPEKMDSFSEENLANILNSTKLERQLFGVSCLLSHKYFTLKHKNRSAAVFYKLLSIVLSPKRQLVPIYHKWHYRRIRQRYVSMR